MLQVGTRAWRRRAGGFALLVSIATAAGVSHAQHHGDHHPAGAAGTAWTSRYEGLHHPTGTKSAEAQRLFDQGLLLTYAFNHAGAIDCFRQALVHDPAFARAHWGIALAESANINAPVTAERAGRALQAIRAAQRLSATASERDRAYIAALALRYTDDTAAPRPPLDAAYADAMKALAARYPDDADAATLFADALMNMAPWDYWSPTGEPRNRVEEILSALGGALALDPEHVGANHYFIHAIEGSANPGRGLPSALRLAALGLDTGHLAHMPSHIHLRLGDFDAVVAENEKAVAADRAFAQSGHSSVKSYAGYAAHNLEFLVVGNSFRGNFGEAMRAADAFDAAMTPVVARSPAAEHKFTRRTSVLLWFARWDAILALPDPGAKQPVNRAFWRHARGIALAARGDHAKAARELRAFRTARAAVPADRRISRSTAHQILDIAHYALDGRTAWAAGRHDAAIAALTEAVRLYDALLYDEPPNWYYPVRETLGAMLLKRGRARDAETVFRADLARTPRNPRSLFGLAKALAAQDRADEAHLIELRFKRAWAHADGALTLDHFV